MKRRRENLNEENTLLVITNYHDDTTGSQPLDPIAIHAKRILTQMSKTQKILILAEKTGRRKTDIVNHQLTVLRIWRKKDPMSLYNILSYIVKYSHIRMIHIQFDFDMYGGLIPAFMFPALIAILKLLGKHVTIELHHVPFDIARLKRHHRIKQPILRRALNWALNVFYRAIGILCDKVIVFEEDLRERLSAHMNPDKVIVLPLGVHVQKHMFKSIAKRRLKIAPEEFVLMAFGYFDWVKGTDWLAKTIQELDIPHVTLLLVGGHNPHLEDNANYQQFYRDVVKTSVASGRRIRIVGFVPEKQMSLYYSAADLVLFPYRELVAAANTLTHALSFHTPVVFSNNLTDYSKSPDFKHAMDQSELTQKELFFPLHKSDFETYITTIINDRVLYKKLQAFSQTLAGARRSTRILKDYHTIVSKRYAMKPRLSLRFR